MPKKEIIVVIFRIQIGYFRDNQLHSNYECGLGKIFKNYANKTP